jgi:hypothetical protein
MKAAANPEAEMMELFSSNIAVPVSTHANSLDFDYIVWISGYFTTEARRMVFFQLFCTR